MAALVQPQPVYLGIGGNQGDRQNLLRAAVALLAPAVTLLHASSLYETKPWGYAQQAPFLNAALYGTTSLAPHALLRQLKAIERQLGRRAGPRYGPRPIDLDILIYGDLHMADKQLSLPHPRIAERSFVLVPLAELAPMLQLTPGGPTIEQLRQARPDLDDVRRFAERWLEIPGI